MRKMNRCEKKALILSRLQVIILTLFAAVVKLADALDSKSSGSDIVPVQVRPAAPKTSNQHKALIACFFDMVWSNLNLQAPQRHQN